MLTAFCMERKTTNLLLHVSGCLAFLIIPIILSPRPSHLPLFSKPTMRDFLANIFMLLFFYLNYYVFIPRTYFKRKYWIYGTSILLGFLLITFLPSLMTGYNPLKGNENFSPGLFKDNNFMPRGIESEVLFLTQVKHNIVLYIAVILFSLLLRIRMKLFATEVLKYNAEMGTLKNQINPHFLFNTLNNIYAFAIREKAPTTASSILKLSGMMRYVVTETEREFVSLEKEIAYTNDYIDLQKMRLTNSINLSYTVSGNLTDQKIAPMILMPFIENAFKHGVNPDQESYINIRVDILKNQLELIVENQHVKTIQALHTQSGVGIENTKSRLELLYPRKYFLSINNGENHYSVKLNITLS